MRRALMIFILFDGELGSYVMMVNEILDELK
jgi:hypothetical protein